LQRNPLNFFLFEAEKTLHLYLFWNKEKQLTYFELKSQTFSTASYKGRISCHVMEPPLHHMRGHDIDA
jgi:hypothetical protein